MTTESKSNLRPPWKKGQSGNPSGRSSSAGFAARLRAVTRNGEEAQEVVLDLMRASGDERIRLDAAKYVIERCFGRVPDTLEDPVRAMTDEEVWEKARKVLETKEGLQ